MAQGRLQNVAELDWKHRKYYFQLFIAHGIGTAYYTAVIMKTLSRHNTNSRLVIPALLIIVAGLLAFKLSSNWNYLDFLISAVLSIIGLVHFTI